MTTRTDAGAEKSFVSALLPWIVAAVVAVIYLLTLNHWLSFKNLQPVARLTGRIWVPELYTPMFTLVTTPFRWLPAAWIPLALNVFSTVCAFFVLALLARSVVLLPQDRTQKQRERLHNSTGLLTTSLSWLPPLLAVLVCGLQLTFWENATTLSSGMFDLVLFAYSVRCLLEYRISKQESWILRAAVVYAAGMTDTWVMLALFPAFIAAIIWIRGLSFFQLNFLSKLFLCTFAGLLLYLYLPLINYHNAGVFWLPLKANLQSQISEIIVIFKYTPHHVQLLLVMTSLLPLFVIGIRWKSRFGDISGLGVALATWIFHLVHLALLALCVWAAFDAGFGLRDSLGRFPILTSNRDQLLILYFLGALSIGYFAGYFLMVFQPPARRGRPQPQVDKFFDKVSIGFVCLILVIAPIGLLYKNFPQIRITNGPALENYASLLTEHLPPQGIVLSDNAPQLLIAQTWLARTKKDADLVFLETHSIKSPEYYRAQTRRWPDLVPKGFLSISNSSLLTDAGALNLLISMSEKLPVYYLHPSFGYYFEAFYTVPHGMAYELKRFPTNDVTNFIPPPLSEAVFAENETFWKQHDPQVRALLPAVITPNSREDMTPRQRLLDTLDIPIEKNYDVLSLATVYSRALNTWGVRAQQMGRLEAAGAHFDEAAELCPENVVAKENSAFNKKLRKGDKVAAENPSAFEARFGKYSSWEQILSLYGEFDEPTGCLAQGIVFARGKLDRQAAQCLERSLELAPDGLLARLWLARVYVGMASFNRDFAAKALPLVAQLKERASSFNDAAISSADVFQLELAANYVDEKPATIKRLVSTAISRNPPDDMMLSVAAHTSVFYRDYTNALLVADRQLTLSPTNTARMVNKGFLQIQLRDFDAAIATLSAAISIQPTNSEALFCRAMAYMQSNKLDESQRDFETLQKLNSKSSTAYHGLAEIALRRKDTNAAIHFYELDLTNSAPDSPDAKFAEDRLKQLKPGSP